MCWCSQMCLVTSPGPVHQQFPTPPPTAAIFLFEVSNAATAVEKANLSFKKHCSKKHSYFSGGSLTGILKPTRKAHEHPPSTTILGVLTFWVSSFLRLRWRMFMLPPVKDLWCHLQTLTAPRLPDTLCLPFIPAALSSKEEPAPFCLSSCEEKPSCSLWVLPEELKIPILHLFFF